MLGYLFHGGKGSERIHKSMLGPNGVMNLLVTQYLRKNDLPQYSYGICIIRYSL
jgi:hypothetical protein